MAETKLTKIELFNMTKEAVNAAQLEAADETMLIEFLDAQIDALNRKAEKAKERAAKAKVEGDALRARVEEVLTDELQTVDEITAIIGDEEVTKNKVVARLTQLAKAGIAAKDFVKGENGKKVAYRLVSTEDNVETE